MSESPVPAHADIGEPLQLQIRRVTVAGDALRTQVSQQQLYVEVSWRSCDGDSRRDDSPFFRTTPQTRRLDEAGRQDLSFADCGVLSAPPRPLGDFSLTVRVNRCALFGDATLRVVAVPLADVALVRGEWRHFLVDGVSLDVRPINFDGAVSVVSYLPSAGAPPRDVEARIEVASDPTSPLAWVGPTPAFVPHLPPQYRRPPRLQMLLQKGGVGLPEVPASRHVAPSATLSSVFAAAENAAAVMGGAVVDTAALERMRVHFPELRWPLVDKFQAQLLNGHGVPVDGELFVTTRELAFQSAQLRMRIPLAEAVGLRVATCFCRQALQVFAAGGACYQLQCFDGTICRSSLAAELKRVPSFVVASEIIADLFLLAHPPR